MIRIYISSVNDNIVYIVNIIHVWFCMMVFNISHYIINHISAVVVTPDIQYVCCDIFRCQHINFLEIIKVVRVFPHAILPLLFCQTLSSMFIMKVSQKKDTVSKWIFLLWKYLLTIINPIQTPLFYHIHVPNSRQPNT